MSDDIAAIVDLIRVDETKVDCPECGVRPGFVCQPSNWPGSHKARKEAARNLLALYLARLPSPSKGG